VLAVGGERRRGGDFGGGRRECGYALLIQQGKILLGAPLLLPAPFGYC
jgi:hypothetical protein